jgi:saccharopine dehydrogenase-like NADP-dependent oxidoreductase
MTKTVMLFGYGRMGRTVSYYLRKLGYEVFAVDCAEIIEPDSNIKVLKSNEYKYLFDTYSPHLIVSTLPYDRNIELASLAINNNIAYIDLGGKVSNTHKIREIAADKDVGVFTDLGLAPGLINILTEYYVKQKKNVHSVVAAVGGIPVAAQDYPFNYYCTWSLEGLANEYIDECEILHNGFSMKTRALNGHSFVRINKLGQKLETFYTSGASAHSIERMKELGVKDFKYKTLRYIGHRNFIKSIVEDGSSQDLINIFKRLSDSAPVKKDQVVGWINLVDKNDNELLNHEFLIKSQGRNSAMQIATSTPIVVVADMMLQGYLPNKYLTYSDVVQHMGYFQCKLRELGVEV